MPAKKITLTTIYLLAGASILLILCFILQPLKKGGGADTTTRYEPVPGWPVLPGDLHLGNVTGIGIDTNQHIVIFHRAGREWPLLGAMPKDPIKENTILIIDKDDGKLIASWGSNLFVMPHGLKVDSNNNIWVTDVGLHQVFKFSHDGRLLMRLGEAGIAGNDSLHFNKPTDVAVEKNGSFYVSDGYVNSRIIKFSPEGKYLFEWGKKGDEAGAFNIPHGLALGNDGNVFVADRENNRIQVFDSTGGFIQQFTDATFGSICSVAFNRPGTKLLAVDDLSFLKIKHRGSDVIISDTTGKVQTRFGRSGGYNGSTGWFHCLAVDEDENIYVGDILGSRVLKFRKVVTRNSEHS